MPRTHRCTLTAQLAPRSSTAALLRVITILQSRGAEVLALSYESRDEGATVTATVKLGNIGDQPLRQFLLRPPEVVDVVADWEAGGITEDRLAAG